MTDSHQASEGLWRAWHGRIPLPDAPLKNPLNEMAAIAALVPILMLASFVNGFPIIFYDTGAYILEGFQHIFIAERSPVYSLFLKYAGGPQSLWYIAFVQCAITAFVMTEFVRALKPRLSLCHWTPFSEYAFGKSVESMMVALPVATSKSTGTSLFTTSPGFA